MYLVWGEGLNEGCLETGGQRMKKTEKGIDWSVGQEPCSLYFTLSSFIHICLFYLQFTSTRHASHPHRQTFPPLVQVANRCPFQAQVMIPPPLPATPLALPLVLLLLLPPPPPELERDELLAPIPPPPPLGDAGALALRVALTSPVSASQTNSCPFAEPAATSA